MINIVLGMLVVAVIIELAIILTSDSYQLVRTVSRASVPTLIALLVVTVVAATADNWGAVWVIPLGILWLATSWFTLSIAVHTLRYWGHVN